MMGNASTSIVSLAALTVAIAWCGAGALASSSVAINYSHPASISTRHLHHLTLHKDVYVAGSRHLSQLICAAGTAKGSPHELEKATCTNLHYMMSDDPKWDCNPAAIQPGYVFSLGAYSASSFKMEVSCEPFNGTDHLVIEGSCLLRYRLDIGSSGATLATTFIELGAVIVTFLTTITGFVVAGRKWFKRRLARDRSNLIDTSSVISDSTLATDDLSNAERYEDTQGALLPVDNEGTTHNNGPPVTVSSIIDI